jgi:formylglycine-generating enzyme required for sulfatase activity
LAADRDNFLEIPGLVGLRLGKYPVTVEEYKRFVDDRGYDEERYWQEVAGRALKADGGWEAPGNWDEQRPVTEVSWYEAVAYCCWLREQRGVEVRLPTTAEWQTAARPVRGPWGEEEPDEERAHFDNDVLRPTPVGIYPSGNGPYGHCDLTGNVLEWCEDLVPVKDSAEEWRALKGGGWFNAAILSSAFRDGNSATLRNDVIGFRVAAVPASPSPPGPLSPASSHRTGEGETEVGAQTVRGSQYRSQRRRGTN